MSSYEPNIEPAEHERKSTFVESLKDGAADIAVELTGNVVVETMATVIGSAAHVVVNAGETIVECASAAVEGIADGL